MAGVSLTFYLSHIFLLYGLSEFYYTKYLSSPYYFSQTYSINVSTNINLLKANINKLIYCLVIQFFASLSWKLTIVNIVFQANTLHHYIIFLSFIVGSIVLLVHQYFPNNNNYILLIWLILILNFFYFANNLLIFILLLEVIATIYYFFFLNTLESNTVSLIKLKNLIINYLWLSLLTLIFFSYVIFFFITNVGTLDFHELFLFKEYTTTSTNLFLLCTVFWKIGLPGFHFFKYEIYRFLPLGTIFYFSLFSVFTNIFLLFFIASNFTFIVGTAKYFLILFILISNVFLLVQGIDNLKFFQFLALSGLNTVTTIMLFILL